MNEEKNLRVFNIHLNLFFFFKDFLIRDETNENQLFLVNEVKKKLVRGQQINRNMSSLIGKITDRLIEKKKKILRNF